MPMLIKSVGTGFAEAEDTYVRLEDDAPDPGGDILVSLARFLEAGRALASARSGRLGVRLSPDDAVESLEGRLGGVSLVALDFPKFRDGRAFTSARLLRTRLGFRGEVRAVGDVLRDQAGFMVRCGFDAFVPSDGSDPEAWAAAAVRHRHVYQRAADGRTPAFDERRGA
ncbi:MAG: hypothetical protein RL588_2417 [Pseudomonadota bacterium]|jgi:uncharacterized protein (DUF934 family)